MRLKIFALGLGLSVLGFVRPTHAEHVRAHGTLSLAKPFGGFQERELPWGGVAFGAVEMPLMPQLGAELELGMLFLGSGDPPTDPTILPQGGAHAIYGAVGLQARPFRPQDPAKLNGLSGIWGSSHLGATTTGGLFRAVIDLHVGYDFLIERGKYGVGPTLGLVHVFQSDSEVRPDDANIVVLGAHVMFDSAPPWAPSDRDHDGILDEKDSCPDVPEDKDGFEDTDGCPDLDNDRDTILDPADHCPNDPEDKDGFEDADGCPDPDNDKDKILDPKDKCPNEPEDFDGFEDGDGCPDTDNDHDGILDLVDLCPNEPETKNGYADEDGCPDEDQVRVVGEKIVLDDRVNFEQNNAIIRPVSFPLLERLSKLVREHPEYTHIQVEGHTDQKGTAEYNKKLSEDRAGSVLEFMVAHGVDRGRLNAIGFGSEHLLVDATNERALYLNRRVEFVITRQVSKGGSPAPGAAPPPSAAPGPDAAGAAPGGTHNETGSTLPASSTVTKEDTVTRISRALLAFALVAGAGSAPVGCSGGVVGGECRNGYGACHGHCTDFRSDSDNCGSCGNVCPGSGSCVDSVCSGVGDASTGGASTGSGGAKTGTGGTTNTGGLKGSGGVNVNAGGTPNAGGTVGSTGGTSLVDAGPGGASGAGGTGGTGVGGSGSTPDAGNGPDASGFDAGVNCFPPYDTPDNCGTCHHRCVAPTPLCSPGNDKYVCTQLCTPPLTQCGDVCVNTDTDEDNCGQCGNICASGICQGGKCVGANAGHEVMFCMDLRTQPASGAPQQRLLGNAIFLAAANPVRVLAFSEYAPPGVVTQVNSTLQAAATARGRTFVLTPATTTLEITNKLSIVNYDALLVYDQSTAPAGVLSTIGSGLAGTVDSFVRAGGTAVVLAGDGGRAEMLDFLSAGGFMTASAQTSVTGAQIYNRAPGDAVGLGVLSSFRAARETCTFTVPAPDAFTSFVVTDTPSPGALGAPVVVHRVLAP